MSTGAPNRAPSSRDLRHFGLILLLFFALVGAVVAWQSGSQRAAGVVWVAGAVLAAAYFAVRPLRRPLYGLWMAVFTPVGWIVSQLLLGIVFYGLITPMAIVARLAGRDPLARRFEPDARSYWVEEDPSGDPERYFRQS